jgi:hypothetical protein
MDPFMLALMASGMVIDWTSTHQQAQIGKWGAQVEQAGIENNIATNRLDYEEKSLESMKQLRKVMGTQAAIFAARGSRGNAGSAVALSEESISNWGSDERTKRMNMLNSEAQLKAGKTLSQLHQTAEKQKLWNSFAQRTIGKLSTNPEAWDSITKSFGLTKV